MRPWPGSCARGTRKCAARGGKSLRETGFGAGAIRFRPILLTALSAMMSAGALVDTGYLDAMGVATRLSYA
jgi:multidrug efflux pump subunit AcrB